MPRSTGWSRPSSSSAAAGRPTPPIRSSMRWCATPRPTASCAASFAGSTPPSPGAFEAFEVQPPPELIAWHAELAGLDRKAVDYLLLAGSGAIVRYANQEAIHHLERALRLIAAVPEKLEQDALELRALAMIGVPRIALHGYASKEVEATYRRTVELAERTGDTAQLFQGLRGLWNCIYDRADLENAREIAERLCARWRSITRKRKPRGWPIARWAPPVSASAGSRKPSTPSRRASRPAPACRPTRGAARAR